MKCIIGVIRVIVGMFGNGGWVGARDISSLLVVLRSDAFTDGVR